MDARGTALRAMIHRMVLHGLFAASLLATPGLQSVHALPAPRIVKDEIPRGRLGFQSYGPTQGLTNLSVWCMEQDTDGFLWTGTEEGLFRYDGSRFQAFGPGDGLPSAWVRTLCVDSGNRLWIGTLHGVALRENGRFRNLGEASGLPNAEVFALAKDRDQRLWVATEHGLFRQRKDGRFEAAPGWPDKGLARALLMDGDRVYVTQQGRLLYYDLRSTAGPLEVAGPWKERLDALARDGQGRFWVRSRAGLWMRPAEGQPFQDFSAKLGLPAAYDGALRVTPAGVLLIPTVEGLVRVKGDAWERITETQGLPVPWANRAMEDREGNLWIGGLGLHRTLGHEVWYQHTHKDGIPGGVVRSILKDARGRFWIGTVNGVCTAGKGAWHLVPETRDQAIMALALAPDGALWMGGAPARLRRWMPGTNQWQEFPQPESTITALQFDPSGNLWVATRRQGLFCMVKELGNYHLEPIKPAGWVPDERIESMVLGNAGRLWLGSTHGLLLFENSHWRRFGPKDGLLATDVTAVFEQSNGDLWVSGAEVPGLSRFHLQDGRLALQEHIDARQGFDATRVFFMREDAWGRIWAGTSQGIYMLEGKRIHRFTTADGLPGDDFNGNGFCAEPNGDVWVAAMGGLARFDAAAYRGFLKPPPSYVLSVQFGSATLEYPFQRELKLRHRDASLTFRFTGLTYLGESRIQHQIRLVGLENAWRTTDIRQARYTNLAPGHYRFEVRAGFGDGNWGPPAVVSFQVLPAWWQRWWFRILLLAGSAGLIGLWIELRSKALHRRNQELEATVNARTKALAEANQILQQLTVTDPLTGLKNRRFLDLTIAEDLAKVHRDYNNLSRGLVARMPANVDLLFCMVDLDHFKWVNDTHGHAAGDQLLQQVRDRLLSAVRDTDTVVRWGGEEFLVVARNFDRSQAESLASRILDLMRSRPFDLGNGVEISKTCSLGFAPYPFITPDPDAVVWQKVVELADRCLYAAKESGRDGWVGLHGGPLAPADVRDFLVDPEAVLKRAQWRVSSSFPETKELVWH